MLTIWPQPDGKDLMRPVARRAAWCGDKGQWRCLWGYKGRQARTELRKPQGCFRVNKQRDVLMGGCRNAGNRLFQKLILKEGELDTREEAFNGGNVSNLEFKSESFQAEFIILIDLFCSKCCSSHDRNEHNGCWGETFKDCSNGKQEKEFLFSGPAVLTGSLEDGATRSS